MAPIKTMTFTRRYAENDMVEALNFILSLAKCLVKMPLVQKQTGVKTPKTIGIHIGSFGALLASIARRTGLTPTTLDKLMQMVHATMAIKPMI